MYKFCVKVPLMPQTVNKLTIGLCDNNDKSIIAIINTIVITIITICIIAIITMCIINTTIYISVFTVLFLINILWLRGGQEAIPYANTEVSTQTSSNLLV